MHNCEIITNTLANDQIHKETATEEKKKHMCIMNNRKSPKNIRKF